MSRRFVTPIESDVQNGTAPLIVDSSTLVSNFNADLLDGEHGSYYAPIASPTFTGTVTVPGITSTGDLIPLTDNTGVVGNASKTWSNGQFTNLTIDSTLNVRAAIDLADLDILRFGSSDDVQIFYDGTSNILDIELEASAVSLNITDNGTDRVVITKSTGTISAGEPTADNHLATKAYVDSKASSGGGGLDPFFLSGM